MKLFRLSLGTGHSVGLAWVARPFLSDREVLFEILTPTVWTDCFLPNKEHTCHAGCDRERDVGQGKNDISWDSLAKKQASTGEL